MIPEGDKDWDRGVARRVQAVSRGRVTGSIAVIREQRSSTFTVQTRPNNTRPRTRTRNRSRRNAYVGLSFDPGSLPLVAGVGRATDRVAVCSVQVVMARSAHFHRQNFKCLHGAIFSGQSCLQRDTRRFSASGFFRLDIPVRCSMMVKVLRA